MVSMAVTKALVWRGMDDPEEQHLLDSKAMHVTGQLVSGSREGRGLMRFSGNSVDSKEGVQAFKEKRAAVFPATVPKDLPTEL